MTFEWVHIAASILSAALGGVAGLVAGTWKIAHIEQDIRKDFAEEIAKRVQEREERLNELAVQFDETLKALRQKINDVELYTVRDFLKTREFDDFRTEYREDMRDLKQDISRISSR